MPRALRRSPGVNPARLTPTLLLATACATTSAGPPVPELRPIEPRRPTRAAQAMLDGNGTPQSVWPLRGPWPLAEVHTVAFDTCRPERDAPIHRDATGQPTLDDRLFRDAVFALECAGRPHEASRHLYEALRAGWRGGEELAQLYALDAYTDALRGRPEACVEGAVTALALGGSPPLPASAPPAAQTCWAAAGATDPAANRPHLSEPVVTVADHRVRLAFTLIDRYPLASSVRVYHRPHGSALRYSQLDVHLEGRTNTTLYAPVLEVNVVLPELAAGDLEYYAVVRDRWGNRLHTVGSRQAPLAARPR